MPGKFVLGLVGITFAVYGVYVLFSPAVIANFIGYELAGPDAGIELLAMYGGLEIGVGLFCIAGLLNQQMRKPALLAVILIVGGLAIARVFATFFAPVAPGSYTYGALLFEFTCTTLALFAYLNSPRCMQGV